MILKDKERMVSGRSRGEIDRMDIPSLIPRSSPFVLLGLTVLPPLRSPGDTHPLRTRLRLGRRLVAMADGAGILGGCHSVIVWS